MSRQKYTSGKKNKSYGTKKDLVTYFAVSQEFKRVYILRNVPRAIATLMVEHADNPGKLLLLIYNQWLSDEERQLTLYVRFANLLAKDFYRNMYRYASKGLELQSSKTGLDEYQVVGDSRGVMEYKRATGCFLDYINGWKSGHVERI